MNKFWLTCLRCGHEWLKRSENDPKRCPKCGTAYWDKKVTRQSVSDKVSKYWQDKKGDL